MKVQCPECREIVAMEEFSTSADGLRFRCSACGQTHFLPNPENLGDEGSPQRPVAAPALPPSDQNPDVRTCPKCGHAQLGGQACTKCGLDFLRFDPDNLPPDPPEAVLLWDRVVQEPGDHDLHERFIKTCNDAGRLDYATRQYRILGRLPGLAQVAERMRVRIVSLAQAQMGPTAMDSGSSEKSKRTTRMVLWVVLILALGGMAYLIYSSSEMLKKLY